MALESPPPGALLTEEMFSPGAAIPTHGPAMVNADGWPVALSAPTEST